MGKIDRGIVLLVLLTMVFAAFLSILSESRVDAYVSISILVYFIYTSIDISLRRYSKLKPLDIAFTATFITIVAIRILEVLEVF